MQSVCAVSRGPVIKKKSGVGGPSSRGRPVVRKGKTVQLIVGMKRERKENTRRIWTNKDPESGGKTDSSLSCSRGNHITPGEGRKTAGRGGEAIAGAKKYQDAQTQNRLKEEKHTLVGNVRKKKNIVGIPASTS